MDKQEFKKMFKKDSENHKQFNENNKEALENNVKTNENNTETLENNIKTNENNNETIEKDTKTDENKETKANNYIFSIKEENEKRIPNVTTKVGKVVNCACLNVREKPSLDAKVVKVINVQTQVDFSENNNNLDWVEIYDYDLNRIGYCLAEYIREE